MTDRIRFDRFFEPILTLNIDGVFNEDTLLSLRANQTRLLGVGNQDFIINYRNSLLANRNTGYNIPEDFDLTWSYRQGPIINPNQIAPCYVWIKPEDFGFNGSESYVFYAKNRGKYQVYTGDFYSYVDELSQVESSVPIGPKGNNGYRPLAFDGESYLVGSGTESSDMYINKDNDFIWGFVITTKERNTGVINTIISAGKENEEGHTTISLDESYSLRKVVVNYFINGKLEIIESDVYAYGLNQTFILIIARIGGQLFLQVNGYNKFPTAATISLLPFEPPELTESQSFLGGVLDIDFNLTNGFNHSLYEAVLLKPSSQTSIDSSSIGVLEGYFATKYKLQNVLPNNHPYKTEIPRTSIIEKELPIGPVEPEQECDVLLISPTSLSVPVQGTTQEFLVTVEDVICTWQATTQDNWISIQNSSGSGNGSFLVTISTNDGAERIGTITVTGENATPVTITVTQEEVVVSPAVDATGGTETTEGSFVYHTFTSDGTFEVLTGGEIEYIVVAGGGGGGRSSFGSGGGAGGMVISSETITPGTYSVVVGSGGSGATYIPSTAATNGQNSTFNGTTAIGGGAGAGWVLINGNSGGSGGGGGGAVAPNVAGVGGSGTPGQGYSGGNGLQWTFTISATGGGGGGAAEAGDNGEANKAGNGGDGLEWPLGSGNYYAGGGGGTRQSTSGLGLGGLGGGGNQGDPSADPSSSLADGQPGTPNTGGGGGSGLHDYRSNGGNGGSGIVIIRYTTDGSSPSSYVAPSFTYVPTIGEPE